MDKRDELKEKLRVKIKNQKNQRSSKDVKETVVDDNLKKLGIAGLNFTKIENYIMF